VFFPTQTWTIAALLPSWVLYPWSRRVVVAAEERGRAWGLAALMLAAWGLEFGAMVYVYKRQGNNLTLEQHYEVTRRWQLLLRAVVDTFSRST
jgi:hypothetical protein